MKSELQLRKFLRAGGGVPDYAGRVVWSVPGPQKFEPMTLWTAPRPMSKTLICLATVNLTTRSTIKGGIVEM